MLYSVTQPRDSLPTQNMVCLIAFTCPQGKLTMISKIENEVLLFYISVARGRIFDKMKDN